LILLVVHPAIGAGGMKRRLPNTRHGEVVVTGDSNVPPTITDANPHTVGVLAG
jgi:hypothetical protein